MAQNSGPVYAQSGVIPFICMSDQVAVLLITNRTCKRWIIPKGLIESDLTARESAVKEAYEEGGIKGRTSRRAIGQYQYQKWGGTCNVKVFLFEVEDVLMKCPEAGFRHRVWMNVEVAAGLVREQVLGKIIRRVPVLLDEMTIK